MTFTTRDLAMVFAGFVVARAVSFFVWLGGHRRRIAERRKKMRLRE